MNEEIKKLKEGYRLRGTQAVLFQPGQIIRNCRHKHIISIFVRYDSSAPQGTNCRIGVIKTNGEYIEMWTNSLFYEPWEE